ncbi:MAG: class I SAM-dependent methyltransferase [Deltaproteobacteria bacterium]|nr:class I SAM-dependent methyltransferase [Deltaproteobacteria bacterium]MCB9787487.1 class I SAM-dependent methyltransferase [Deltaproteobacteria bacterium]
MYARHDEMRILRIVLAVLVALAVGSGLAFGRPMTALVVLGATALIVTLQILSHISIQRSFERERAQNRALLHLHALLPLRSPLPPLTGWAATPELAVQIIEEALARRPEVVVEAGSGASTLVTGYCLEKLGAGRVVSLDHDAEYAAHTQRSVGRHALDAWCTVQHAPLTQYTLGGGTWKWYDISKLPAELRIDMLSIDGPPGRLQRLSRYPALPLLASRLNDGAIIVLDDAARPDERALVARWQSEFPGLEHRFIPTQKGISVLRWRAPAAAQAG